MKKDYHIPGYTRTKVGSVDALVKELASGAELGERVRTNRYQTGDSWRFGSYSPAETARFLESGEMTPRVLQIADETRSRLETAMRTHDDSGISARRRHVWADTGDTPDVDRVLAGHDRPWQFSQRGRPGRIVRLGLNFWLSCGNSEEDFARIVGVACATADVLATLGYGSEIVVFAAAPHTDQKGPWMVVHWTAKRADEYLDLGRIGCVGMPGALRSGVFSEWEKIDSRCGSGSHDIDKIRPLLGVDHIIGRRWSEMSQKDIYEGIVSMLATHESET